jgi:hypothetical protein
MAFSLGYIANAMIADQQRVLQALDQDGYVVLHGVFAVDQVQAILAGLDRAFKKQADQAAIRSDGGSIYAARNILFLWPEAATIWRQPPLPELLGFLLGSHFGLVRGLFFDKPPDQTWALPWHKDLTIAVREHRPGSQVFAKPTTKAGVTKNLWLRVGHAAKLAMQLAGNLGIFRCHPAIGVETCARKAQSAKQPKGPLLICALP